MPRGKVYLIGAGPGDPGLFTIKGLDCIRRADIVVYDRLAHPVLLSSARPHAELIFVGKRSSTHTLRQEEINHLLCTKASEGKVVARLKGGDPFVFGRGGEEAEALLAAGIEFEVVPGVSSAFAVPAYAGIPVTHRGVCSSIGIITGHEETLKPETDIKWEKIATGLDTIVFLMGVENLPQIISRLLENGRGPDTPVALIRWGTRSEQETLVGTLESITGMAERDSFKPPAVIVVGEVVRLREKLRWFDNRPLFKKKVLVTRSRDQASALSEVLREHGAEPVEFPVIRISPLESFAELDAAIDRVEEYDWLIFTSANGVKAVVDRIWALGGDARWLKGPKIVAIGPKTAESVERAGMRVAFTPPEYIAESIAQAFPEDPAGKRILILRAADAREALPEMLAARGAVVTVVEAYRTEIEESDVQHVADLLASGKIDIVTFTSSSTARNFAKLIGSDGRVSLPEGVMVACMGPITAETAAECGMDADVVSDVYTIEGMVQAIDSAISTRETENPADDLTS